MSSRHLVGRPQDGSGTFPQLSGLPEETQAPGIYSIAPLAIWAAEQSVHLYRKQAGAPAALAVPVPDCTVEGEMGLGEGLSGKEKCLPFSVQLADPEKLLLRCFQRLIASLICDAH